ncbi:MAG: SAF domain-containing protein [Propionibacteriaceae bacterium]|nr:SAF domain-containing protein [Propionibacteriaceae bacterium]
MNRLTAILGRILMHRRLLAALSAGVCALAMCSLATGTAEPTVSVYTAAVRIPAGASIAENQVHIVAVPSSLLPQGAITSANLLNGQMTATAIPAGAILTEDNFVPSSRAANGLVIIALPVSSHILTILKPGDHISIFLTNPMTGDTQLNRGVRVVTIPTSSSGVFSPSSGDVILVEVSEELAALLTSAGSLASITIAIE